MADRARRPVDLSQATGSLRWGMRRVRAAPAALRRAWRGDLDGLDRYFAVVLPLVFAAFYVLDKSPHRPLFYVFALLPMVLYLRRPVLAEVSQSWPWRLGVGLCGLWLVSVAWSGTATLESAFDAVRTAVAVAVFLTACIALVQRGRFPETRIVHAVVVTAAVCAVLTFVLATVPGSGFAAEGRLKGFGWADHSGNGADIYGFAAVVALVLAVEGRGRLYVMGAWAAAAVCVVFVLLAESRAPALGLIAAAVALGAAKSPRVLLGLGAILVVAGAAVYGLGLVDFADWIARGPAYRFQLWTDALQRIAGSPVLGAGGADTGMFAADGRQYTSPHNGVIGMFYYLGALGGGLFLALCGYAVWHAGRHALAGGSGLTLAMLAFGLTVLMFHTNAVIVMLNRDWLLFWLPVILVAATRTRAARGSP